MRSKTSEARGRYAHAIEKLNDARLAAQFARTCDALAATSRPGGRILGDTGSIDRARRVGLLAGSFNPLTRAHVALGDAAKTAGRLDAFVWALTVVTVDKERVERASLVDRLLQMFAFVEPRRDALALINRGLYVEQAAAARQLLPHVDELVVVVGFDKLVQIMDPRYYADRDAVLDRLFGAASLLVAPRGDEDETDLNALITREENRRYRDRIAFCPLPRRLRRDSSSKARALAGELGNDHRLRALLPPEGRALATATGAYAPEPESAYEQQRRVDSYSERQELIAWLASLDPERMVDAPGLDELIATRLDPSHGTNEVATWLARVE